MKELFTRIVINGESASSILSNIKDDADRGHKGEGILRLLILNGIHPSDPSLTVIPYSSDPKTRRIETMASISDRLNIIHRGKINSGGSDKIDVLWREGDQIAVCSSKMGKIKSIDDLEITDMLVQFTESGGYTEAGKKVIRSSIKTYVLVYDRSAVLKKKEKSKASNKVTKDNLENILDVSDLDRMCAVLLERIKNCPKKDSVESIVSYLISDEKAALRTRFHQKLICSKLMRLIHSGKKTILIGALPRSGKTWMGAYLSQFYKKILIITTRPGETRSQWNKVFTTHREFSDYIVQDLNSSSCTEIALSNNKGDRMVAVASIQFFKMDERESLRGLDWDLVILDEIHEGGSTELSHIMLDTYIGNKPIRIMMTATYTKPVEYYNIPDENCGFWDLEDIRLMRSWGEPAVFARLCEKYGASEVTLAREESYKSGETDDSIRMCYTNAPCLAIMTTIMQSDIYNELRIATSSPENVYGFSMRSLFMPTKDGKSFQNQNAVDTFLALISGSDKMKHYKKGDMSMFARIRRYWKTIGHRDSEEFITQMWFIPSGVGQLLEHVKPAMIARIGQNSVLKHFATLTLDAGMGDISKAVSSAVVDAKEQGKKGLILLTGNVGSLGVSLPEVDVAFMLHDKESADLNYQQMLRILTEMVNKKCGIVVDFNVWRVLTTLNTYATSRCGQTNKSSAERISWCVSNLIDVDPDLWECKESNQTFTKETIADELSNQWRKMLEHTGTSLSILSRKFVDLGEDDQRDLDQIARCLSEGSTSKNKIETNTEQEQLPSGIVQKSGGNADADADHDDADADADADEDKKNADEIVKNININDVLARLIPEISLLSGCNNDLLAAFETICKDAVLREALNIFITELYAIKRKDPMLVLTKIIKNSYKKLNDAREIYEFITSKLYMMLDKPQELVTFLTQHLKPKELEKKQNGEVFTPPNLIGQKFDKLTLYADPELWSNPTLKFLDPANGIGNYPALEAYPRLMKGLEKDMPNVELRKKHILEKMLYMCEINPKNVEVCRKIFDPEGVYALNLFQGSYLDLDPVKEWGVEKFDVIFGNPPYQPPSDGKKGGKSLWPTFVKRSINILKADGFLVFVHPALWRKPDNELHDLMFSKQIHYMSIHNIQEGKKTFQAGTRYDWYILQNKPVYKETLVKFDDNVKSSIMITPALPYIVNHGGNIMEKVRGKISPTSGCLKTEMTCEGHTQREYISKQPKETHPYPVFNSSSAANGIVLLWSSKALTHQYKKKVLFSNGGIIKPFYDAGGKFGTSQGGIYIFVNSDAEGNHITRFLSSKLISYIVAATKWSNFETNKQIFWSIPHPKDLPENFTDAQVYAYFGLTAEEIGCIEQDQHGAGGLADYVALEAPAVNVPAQVVAQAQVVPAVPVPANTDYTKMIVKDLKQLCKDRKIKGISGKTKEELIALLMKA